MKEGRCDFKSNVFSFDIQTTNQMINAPKMVSNETELDKEAERAFQNVTTTTHDDFDEEFDSAFEIKNNCRSEKTEITREINGRSDHDVIRNETINNQERIPVKTEALPTSLPSSLG